MFMRAPIPASYARHRISRLLTSSAGRDATPPADLRPITTELTDTAYDLWCAFVGESSEAIQLDRWGPGLPVLMPSAGMSSGQASPDDYELTPVEPSQAVRQALDAVATREGCGGFIAFRDDAAIGFLVYSVAAHPPFPGQAGVIEALYVCPPYRGAGAGRALVTAALGELRRLGIHTFSVETPLDNAAARCFWRRVGWQEFTAVSYLYE